MRDLTSRERARQLMMAALDGEIEAAERQELEALMAEDEALRKEWDEMGRIRELTRGVAYPEPPPEVWGRFWGSVYNRIERGVAWVLVSLGAAVLATWGLWHFVEDLLRDMDVPLVIKLAILALIAGGAILFFSVVREKLFTRRHDRYREVQR